MVWRVISILIVCTLTITAFCGVVNADSHSVYDGSISSTYTTYMRDIMPNVLITDNYIFFRSGQYEYTMVTGDLQLNGKLFSGSNCKEYVITSNSSYSQTYTYEVNEISNFSLNVDNNIIYSDLGDYPQLEDPNTQYNFAILLCFVIFCLCAFIRPIFKFTYRNRYIGG